MRLNSKTALIVIAAGLLILFIAGYFAYQRFSKSADIGGTVCTQEAKLCPDGSHVSRTGPNCEFAPCPGEAPIDTSTWKTYRNEQYGFEVRYPSVMQIGDFQDQQQEPPLYPRKLRIYSFVIRDTKSAETVDNFVGFSILDPSEVDNIAYRGCPKSRELICIARENTVGGVRAVVKTSKVMEGIGAGNKIRSIEFIHDQKLFAFYSGCCGLPQQESLGELVGRDFLIDRVAGTFRFLSCRVEEGCPKQIIEKICSQEASGVRISQCGRYFGAYPTGFVADADTKIYDASGRYLNKTCGGYRLYVSEAARKEEEQACTSYLLNCQLVEICR